MFQQEYPYGFSFMDTSLSYDILDYFQNIVVSNTNDVIRSQQYSLSSSSSSYSPTFSCSIAEQQSYSLRVQQAGEEPLRKKRRMRRSNEKSREEKEKQRTNHITVERNRRKQMNHYLSILKSIMPLSCSHHNDQASIIEGAIDYLKQLEQFLQSQEAQLKATKLNQSSNIFTDFFMFPQYSTTGFSSSSSGHHHHQAVADVEVSMMERHFNIKVLTKTRPKLLLKIINEFYSLGFNTLHLNLTTSKDMSLFTFSITVEEDCELKTSSVNEVANVVHEVIIRIHRES